MTRLLDISHIGSTLVLCLNDPGRRNILSQTLCAAISTAVAAAGQDETVKSIVITGLGTAFCAGADTADLLAAASGDMAAVHAVYRAFLDVAACPLPTIAAVNGPAVGAGFNLALACDVRLASTDAVFDTRFLSIGLHPGGGHGWMLQRAVGWATAARMLLFGQELDSAAALAAGLAQGVTEPATLMSEALDLARRADAIPRDLLLRTKQSLRQAGTGDHASAVAHEAEQQLWSLAQPGFQVLLARMQAQRSRR